MSYLDALIDSVRSLSPIRELFVDKLPEALPNTVTVTFTRGQSGILDMKNPRAVHWANVIDDLRVANRPVYVEIDKETNIITRLLIPLVLKVQSLDINERGNIIVSLIPSAAIHYLLQSHPNFEAMRIALQSALDTNSEVLITETRDEHEIIDVRSPPDRPGGALDPSPPAPPDPPVSEVRAQQLFDGFESCVPCEPTSSCIPFRYPDDGCWARAHKMAYIMDDEGEDPEKIWLEGGGLYVETSNHPDCHLSWRYHVAPTLTVTTATGDERRVIDPSLFSTPVSVDDWIAKQNSVNPAVAHRYTAWTDYFGGSTDPNCVDTDYYLGVYRTILKDRCLELGPPPYSCVKNCFFILDRNTFSKPEIEAMLQVADPAVIEAAFYIVMDGYSPYDLGIYSATMAVTPNLAIVPVIPGMTVEPIRLAFEYPSHLNRRQRLTWVYNIAFTNTDAFVSDLATHSLTATIASESSSANIYLILQPNPYELDGETSWLSTDLRVFQIKTGESKFGVAMSTDPSAFITQVISNLNSGDTGGQTFEDNISTDYQTSRLELSERVNGVLTYNFAVAKVRYRADVGDATDVRVFFRLFPVATSSLAYDQVTAYRRGGQTGVTIALLGIRDGEIASIPCFASQRIDSSTTSMNAQTDPTNVQDIPPNPGAEVVRYFGCWLDINQTQSQFPIQPVPTDGPFPSGRKTIQELIRGQHQCLVSEIAYDLAPVPAGGAPSSSDKLAQRNLAIVESANPGNDASHRIPHTFEVRPSKSKLDFDELMIDWGNTPEGSYATIYLPGINTTDIIRMAASKYRSHRLVRIDDHTLRCKTGGIMYIPIPDRDANFPGMLTIDLPSTVETDQAFTIVVRQITSEGALWDKGADPPVKWRRSIGSFQITIPVRTKEVMLEPEERLLSNLRWIERAIPTDNRWFPVFRRYVDQIADRVDGLGGNSSRVKASPSGDWREAYRRCTALALVTAMLLGVLVVSIGTLTAGLQTIIDLPVFILLVVIGYYWIRQCRPPTCRLFLTLIVGVGIGAIVLGVYLLMGVATLQLTVTLVLSIAIAVISMLFAWMKGCVGR